MLHCDQLCKWLLKDPCPANLELSPDDQQLTIPDVWISRSKLIQVTLEGLPGHFWSKFPLYCHFWNLSWDTPKAPMQPLSSAWTYVSAHYDTGILLLILWSMGIWGVVVGTLQYKQVWFGLVCVVLWHLVSLRTFGVLNDHPYDHPFFKTCNSPDQA